MCTDKEGIFFYRDYDFQDNIKEQWAESLYVKNLQTPENFSTFWDNICNKKNVEKTTYAKNQCMILKGILIKNMEVEFKQNDGLYIRDKHDIDIEAILDYRDSSNKELRGETLSKALKNYASNHEKGNVYQALEHIIHSHYHPDFSALVQLLKNQSGFSDRAEKVAFKAIDNILNLENKPDPKERYSAEWKQQKNEAEKQFPEFLEQLDIENRKNLDDTLNSEEFTNKKFSSCRKDAIAKLLEYRDTLFKETKTKGVNLKDKRKASKCHFTEQLTDALINKEPIEKESFKDYVGRCVKVAESNLTKKEAKDWPKGRVSTRLKNLVRKDIMQMEPPTDKPALKM